MSALISTTWEATLEQLNQRDAVIELSRLTEVDGVEKTEAPRRVRLLAFRPNGMAVDLPSMSSPSHFPRGSMVKLLAVQNTHRWEIKSKVLGVVTLRLNDQTEVPALMLARPHEVTSAQRRSFFRVSTGGVDLPAVILHQLPDDAQPCPVLDDHGQPSSGVSADFMGPLPMLSPIKARLLNLGAGGLGLEVHESVYHRLNYSTRFLCRLNLPSLKEPLAIPARLVHREINPSLQVYLGLSFEPQGDVLARRREDQLGQFISWLQRQQLQRIREKR